jgi:transposase
LVVLQQQSNQMHRLLSNLRNTRIDHSSRADVRAAIRSLTLRAKRMRAAIDALVAVDEALRETRGRLLTLPGIGPVVAATLLGFLPEPASLTAAGSRS